MIEPEVILPAVYAERIAASGREYGSLDLKWSSKELLALVDGFRIGFDSGSGGSLVGYADLPHKEHSLAHANVAQGSGVWYRVDPGLNAAAFQARIQSGAIGLDDFKAGVANGWRVPPRGARMIALTYAIFDINGEEQSNWVAWQLSADTDQASWCGLQVVDESTPLLAPLASSWPLEELTEKRVAVIGIGSIGSAIAEALASAGIRHFDLIDPERLQWHNFARHRADWRQVGRLKVNAMRRRMLSRDSDLDIREWPLDVIHDADQLRPLLREVDIAVVATDGVDTRRAVSHLIHRAGKPAIFACVIEDGAYGELQRIRPGATGCIHCLRETLREQGGIDSEGLLDREYGTGTRHLPMTAVTSDLSLIGDLAAKITLATLLEPGGHRDQRLVDDLAIVSLRPKPNRPPPFDLELSGEVRWHPLPPPRSDCPTCST